MSASPIPQRYSLDEDDIKTSPSGIQAIPEAPLPSPPPVPKFTPVPDTQRMVAARFGFLRWAAPAVVGTLVIAVAIANTVAFLVDLAELGGGWYGLGVVASSAVLGALVASAWWAVMGWR